MKNLRKLFGVLLGLSIIAATAVTGTADTTIYLGASEDDPDIVCPEGYERIPYDGGVAFRSKITETADLTALTPDEHNEYFDGDFYIVDDIYVQTNEQTNTSVNSTSEWEYKTVTVNRSIYDESNKSYGTLYATMKVTAQFKWDGSTAKVVGTPNCTTTIESAGKALGLEKENKVISYCSDQGSNFLFGNKYAYVEYVVTISNIPKSSSSSSTTSKDFRLYVSMNRNGKQNTEI